MTALPRTGPERLTAGRARALLRDGAPAFAVLRRGDGPVEILLGDVHEHTLVADLPLPPPDAPGAGPDLVAVLPYRQIAERGLACVDDGAPILAMPVRAAGRLGRDEALDALPDGPVPLTGGGFDVDDDGYADAARRVVTGAIGRGAGSNVVLRRRYRAVAPEWSARAALAVFGRLLRAETGAYWTFLFHGGGRTLIGASPEGHVRLADGRAAMHPISGTFRCPPGGPTEEGPRRFLADRGQAEEQFVVADEELKIMARACTGPRLRAVSRPARTAYVVAGPARLGARDLLRETLPAPTVTGSPVPSACRVIAAHERDGRGYYAGAIALAGRSGGRRTLDSALIVRTAEVGADGGVSVSAGGTLVRHSDPAAVAEETRVEASALLAAFSGAPRTRPPERLLSARNGGLSRFWRGAPVVAAGELAGRHAVIVDAGDDFTAMLAELARALGLAVRVTALAAYRPGAEELVVLGPGPGDPRDLTDPRIARLRALAGELIASRAPTLAVCLGHQAVAATLGMPIRTLPRPEQGVQRVLRVDGRPERVGFYNTFAALSGVDAFDCPLTGDRVGVLRDPATGVVHGLAKPGLRTVQFHVESLLTENGPAILRRLIAYTLSVEKFSTAIV
ncbi:anthranilate synthase family protein [Catenuloplanes atrovinosus]|uniref:anthranilate synthase n=1 Tax=Catenuloplanes atrovinosus TaxID=137266 RepID=A0AAE3YHF7_9ACTN|nr:anthranilate synthase family protein [Catenuloplanes atrovinosus]MDR7273998.1 phenazine biosynthesis protein phzE [Catenuloplanes atrovinosus]